MNEQEILNKAIETYGEESQIDMAIEECSELIQALCKYKRLVKNGYLDKEYEAVINNVYGEVADVQIMMKQMNIIFNTDNITFYEISKLSRLERRLNDEKDNRR